MTLAMRELKYLLTVMPAMGSFTTVQLNNKPERTMSTETKQITMAEFITQHGLKLNVKRTNSNPNMDDDKHPMDHWACVIHTITGFPIGLRSMKLIFSMGQGLKGKEPQLDEVLSCLASDSSSVEQEAFEPWCDNFGYDTDSRKAERTYKTCQEQAEKLKTLLGDEAYDQLLYHTEQL